MLICNGPDIPSVEKGEECSQGITLLLSNTATTRFRLSPLSGV